MSEVVVNTMGHLLVRFIEMELFATEQTISKPDKIMLHTMEGGRIDLVFMN